MFYDRKEAGQILGEKLIGLKHRHPVVVAIPRGGVPVGYEVAQALHAPLDIRIIRKLGIPNQPETVLGAVAEGQEEAFLNQEFLNTLDIPARYLDQLVKCAKDEIKNMNLQFRGRRKPINLKGRCVILVDDGIATGSTTIIAIQRIRAEAPDEIILASPVISPKARRFLETKAEQIVCLLIPDYFRNVGGYYFNFPPVTSEAVKAFLDENRFMEGFPKPYLMRFQSDKNPSIR